MQFSRKEAAQRIGCSLRTLDRHISAGKITVQHSEAKCFEQSTVITLEALGQYLGISDEKQLRARLGLPAEAPTVSSTECPADEPKQESAVPTVVHVPDRPLSHEEQDAEFARRYLAGEIPDSFGNYLGAASGVTALGPHSELIPGISPDSMRDLRYQPIRFHAPRYKPAVARKTGYGVTQADIDAERAALAARRSQ